MQAIFIYKDIYFEIVHHYTHLIFYRKSDNEKNTHQPKIGNLVKDTLFFLVYICLLAYFNL